MTGYTDPGGAHPDISGETLLRKPFRLHELEAAVCAALECRSEAETAQSAGLPLAPLRDEKAIGG